MNKVSHKEISVQGCIDILDRTLDNFINNGFIEANTLNTKPAHKSLSVKGELPCLGGIVILVNEFWGISEDDISSPFIVIKDYTYNVSLRGHGEIFRYDNVHPHSCHNDSHHKHEFDVWGKINSSMPDIELKTCICRKCPKWIGECCYPNLNEILQEAFCWYWDSDNHNKLTKPYNYPPKTGR